MTENEMRVAIIGTRQEIDRQLSKRRERIENAVALILMSAATFIGCTFALWNLR